MVRVFLNLGSVQQVPGYCRGSTGTRDHVNEGTLPLYFVRTDGGDFVKQLIFQAQFDMDECVKFV